MPTVLLKFPHGLGDAAQFTVILEHLRVHRPDWVVDVVCGRGKHTALEGLCRKVYHDQEPGPPGPYDATGDVGWYENYCRYEDRPNSKITNCLQEVFGIPYDPALGRYKIRLPAAVRVKAAVYLRSIGVREVSPNKFAAVIVHYEGNTSTWKKNLKHWQARAVLDVALRAGRVPVVLDWDGRSPLPDQKAVFCPGVGRDGEADLWGGFGSGDAATIAALVHCAEAFVGIDSGPGKCASTTATPALVCWRDHHPVQFHDPAPNTVHLVPRDWRKVPPADHEGVARYFVTHYQYREYLGEHGLAEEAAAWLAEILDVPPPSAPDGPVPFVVPTGIGDIAWALLKIRAAAGDGPVDVVVSGDPRFVESKRSLPFLNRFPFVRHVELLDVPVLEGLKAEQHNDALGRYRYVKDGRRGRYHYLVPNAVLEKGGRIETWLPEYPVDWSLPDSFDWSHTEAGDDVAAALEPFCAFYLGPEQGNVDEGHNRGFLWEPRDWVALGKAVADRGLQVALVGAEYDRSYWERYVRPGVEEVGLRWHDLLGKLEIGETFALLRRAKFLVAYQSGLAIWLHYLGGRVVTFWRPDGDSCHPKRLVSFDERMKDAWTNPAYADRYLGLVYKRETPEQIVGMMEEKGWFR